MWKNIILGRYKDGKVKPLGKHPKIYLIFKLYYDIIILASKPDNRCRRNTGEESPSSIGQGCWVTPSGGDSKESATEIYR